MNEQISVRYIFKVKTNHENMQECSQYCKVYSSLQEYAKSRAIGF